jgi:hypothetical protein
MNLFTANKQWATRPDDEKFKTVEELYNATKAYYETAKEQVVPIDSVRTEADNGDVTLIGKKNVPARFTHWSFGQLCARVGAPANYLRNLPATLACQNLNHGLKEYTPADEQKNVNLLFHSNGSLLLRSFTSDKYSRIWNWEVAQRLLGLQQYGWNPAMPDWNKQNSDNPPLYASDHDMFVFLCNDNYRIAEPGNPDGLKRGTIVVNSEVGASSLKFMHFLYRGVCGNFIIWGVKNLTELKVRHVGNAHERWGNYQATLKTYLESSSAEQETKIASAQNVYLGTDKDAVLDKLFAQRNIGLSRKVLEAGYDAVRPEEDGSPRTAWGIVNGITRYSQSIPFADERVAIDVAAGKIIDMVF